jgi:hypothetical protein
MGKRPVVKSYVQRSRMIKRNRRPGNGVVIDRGAEK